jgi:hypothetical protein
MGNHAPCSPGNCTDEIRRKIRGVPFSTTYSTSDVIAGTFSRNDGGGTNECCTAISVNEPCKGRCFCLQMRALFFCYHSVYHLEDIFAFL